MVKVYFFKFSACKHTLRKKLLQNVDGDYFAAGVTCGRLKISWSLGIGSANEILIDGGKVSDGAWHSLSITR